MVRKTKKRDNQREKRDKKIKAHRKRKGEGGSPGERGNNMEGDGVKFPVYGFNRDGIKVCSIRILG